MVPELMVKDLARSKQFWIDLCGFEVVYQREEEGFVFLDREGAQFMLEEIRGDGGWITAPLEAPLGRGVNFEIKVKSIDALSRTLRDAGWPLYREPEERWPPDEDSAVARGSHSRGTTAGMSVESVGASKARAELMMMMVA